MLVKSLSELTIHKTTGQELLKFLRGQENGSWKLLLVFQPSFQWIPCKLLAEDCVGQLCGI